MSTSLGIFLYGFILGVMFFITIILIVAAYGLNDDEDEDDKDDKTSFIDKLKDKFGKKEANG